MRMVEKMLAELQELAQTEGTSVLELLRRAKVIAAKLGREEDRSWIERELNGYPDGVDVPGYRDIPSVLKVKNPFHGWNPVAWGGVSKVQQHFASAEIRQQMSEILAIATDDGEPRAELTQSELDVLMPGNPDFGRLPAARCFSRTSFIAIVDAVRNRLLDWSLALDAERSREGRAGPKENPVTRARPSMFIGSTVEALKVARAVHAELDHDLEITLWNQNVFEPGNATWLDLITQARSGKFDFALLVLGAEDEITSRGTTSSGPRDNCLLELGLFAGALGPDRTFFLIDRDNRPKIATDLAGITPLSYAGNRSDGNLQSAVGPACEQIRQRVEKLKLGK
jgi:predicted nucleotide-binding protein